MSQKITCPVHNDDITAIARAACQATEVWHSYLIRRLGASAGGRQTAALKNVLDNLSAEKAERTVQFQCPQGTWLEFTCSGLENGEPGNNVVARRRE